MLLRMLKALLKWSLFLYGGAGIAISTSPRRLAVGIVNLKLAQSAWIGLKIKVINLITASKYQASIAVDT